MEQAMCEVQFEQLQSRDITALNGIYKILNLFAPTRKERNAIILYLYEKHINGDEE